MTAPHQIKGQRNIDLSTTVRRNLNDNEFYHQLAQAQAQAQSASADVYNQNEYNSISALEALASQNGINIDASVLGQASQQLAALTEKQRNAYLRTAEQPQDLQHQEAGITRTCSSESKSKKRRKSSRSQSELDVENDPGQQSNCMTQIQSPGIEMNNVMSTQVNEKCTQRRPSRSNRRSVEEQHSVTDVMTTGGTTEAQAVAPMLAKDLNIEQHVLPNRTETPTSPKNSSSLHIPCISPTLKLSPALKGLQLYVPKLVITKIKQRRGSKEVETHQVREVLPSESDVQKTKKRRRSSEEKAQHESSHDSEEGMLFFLICLSGNNGEVKLSLNCSFELQFDCGKIMANAHSGVTVFYYYHRAIH